MQITNCKLSKRVQKKLLKFLYSKLLTVPLPIFWTFSPTPLFCSNVQYAWLSAIIWPWLPMRFLKTLSNWTKAISADGVKAGMVIRIFEFHHEIVVVL